MPPLLDRGGQDGVIRRMIDGIGESGDGHEGDQGTIVREKRNEPESHCFQNEPTDENAAGAVTIHEKTHRRLRQAGRQAKHGDREAELGESHAIDLAQQRKQGRQQQQVKVG